MAYKFQLGSAILSGSTKFEEAVEVAGGLKLSGVDDTALDVSADSFLFRDGDGTMKRDTMADYATAIAGDGLAAASGVLKVDVSDFAGAGLEDDGSENLRIAAAAAGDGLGGGGGSALSVNVDDSGIEINSDTLRLKDSGVATAKIADNAVTLAKMAGITRGSVIVGDASGDPSALALGSQAQLLISKDSDLAYVSVSGDATIDKTGALTIAANAVEGSMLNTDVISAQTELASDGLAAADELMISDGGTLKKIGVDNLFKDGPGLLGAASVDVSADHIMFLDGGATGDGKTVSLVDVATGFAGNGLGASGGVLAVAVSGAIKVSSDKLGLTGSIAGAGLMFEGGADSLSVLEVKIASNGGIAKTAGSSNKSLALNMNGLDAAAVNVANDSIAIVDADDSNKTKKESIADLMTAIAGNGLAASSGVLSLDASEVGDEGVASGDKFVFEDATDNSTKKESIDDIATFMAGDGLAASSGVLAVGVDDSTIETNSDALRIKDAGVTGAKLNTDVISAQAELAHADIADADELMISDGGVLKKTGVDSLRDHFFGVVSGDATIADGGALTIAANAVEDSMVNDNVATGLAGVGLSAASGVLALDASELSDAAVASGDKFVFQDASDDSTKKESIDDIATFMAGTGLTAASGVLNARLDVAVKADGDTLAAGMNYFADLSSDAGVTLPASPAVGDTVIVKAKGLSSAVITISKAGSQEIDGEASVTIESPFGAVTMVYVANNDWRLV